MRIVLGCAFALLLSAPAFAQDDVMASTYGNTVIGKSGMGESHTHYRADHTFDSNLSSAMGSMQVKGTWKLDDKGQICRTYETPPPGMPGTVCIPWTAHKVGDSWKVTMGDRTSDVSLVAGIQ